MIIEARLQNGVNGREKALLELAEKRMLQSRFGSGWYACSLTHSEDDFYHWQNYGDDHRGVAIGFDFKELVRFLSPSAIDRIFPSKIIYESQEAINFCSLIIDIGLSHFGEDYCDVDNDVDAAKAFLDAWGRHADPFSIIFKDEKFAVEKEWRLGRHIGSATESDKPSFSGDGKKRWLIARGTSSDSSYNCLPIMKVIVGDKCSETADTVRNFLDQYDHTQAEITYAKQKI
jgi:Protein of unknown function (DUF2971)